MATTWDNRIKFLVRYMYDLDNNGHLNARDFECLAVKFTILEGRGQWNKASFNRFSKIMTNLWNEISDTADLNRDGAVSLSELQVALSYFAWEKTLMICPLPSDSTSPQCSTPLTPMAMAS